MFSLIFAMIMSWFSMFLLLVRSLVNFSLILVDSNGLEIESLNQDLLAYHLEENEWEIIFFKIVVTRILCSIIVPLHLLDYD